MALSDRDPHRLNWPEASKKLRSKLGPRGAASIAAKRPRRPSPRLKEAEAASSSSSCFASGLTGESSSVAAPANPRKRGREYVQLRPVTRLYAKKLEEEEAGLEDEAPLRSRAKGIASDCASDLTVSGISRVPDRLPVPDRRMEAPSCAIRDAAPAISESCSTGIAAKSPEVDRGKDRDLNEFACSESLSAGSDYSTCNEMTLSEFESELFGEGSSQDYFSDVSLSYITESSDNFSERSTDDRSETFSLFRNLSDQLLPLALPEAATETDHADDFILLRFEREEDEESYRAFRSWERRIPMPAYADGKEIAPECEPLVLQERLLMIHWMLEHSNVMQLQNETLFLGVSLMDRFLSRGYFQTKKNLHLLGIACVTLATRIEENQPYNNVRRKTFLVGDHRYSRIEVVAMEWLVQKVLNFQCIHPTIYNFLWFYLKAARADAKVESLTKYLAVMCLLDHQRLRFWPSSVAAGLVVLASLAEDYDDSCQWVMETHVRTRNDDLPECIKSLEWLVKHASC